MDFMDELQALATRIDRQREHIQTEEATKTSFVLPFLSALGYNVFDPTEVTPELNADIGIKRGEKVDYAILRDGKPVILIECKDWQTNLDRVHASQLYRYFTVTDARIGVLTNGIVYRFFSDLEQPNRMDDKPFLEVDLLDLKEPQVQELKRLRRDAFDIEEVLSSASDLKYTREVRRVFSENVANPSEDFVRFFASQVHGGRLTKSVLEEFADYVKRALSQYVSDRISDRLRSALDQESAELTAHSETVDAEEAGSDEDGIETTEDEERAYYIVTAILSRVTDPARVVMRDTKSYCGILLDDNNRKPICRLHFNRVQYYLGLFDADKNEERVAIDSVRDIYQHADRLRAMVPVYDGVDD